MTNNPGAMPALEPCPFCNGVAAIDYVKGVDAFPVNQWVVKCSDCLVTKHNKDKNLAIAAWNRRAPADFNAAIESAAQMARDSYACDCEEAWTSRNMHSPDCFGQLMQETADDILTLKKES